MPGVHGLAGLAVVAALAAAAPAPVPPKAPPAHAVAPDPVRAEFDAALAPGLGDSTAARLGRFLAAHPRHPLAPAARFELGTLAYARGEYVDAREQFRRARAGDLAGEARYWEGLSAFALGRPRDARDAVLAVAHAGRDVPRRWDSAYLVALSWAQEGRRPEALAAYRDLLALPAGPAQAAALYQAQRLAAELEHADDAQAWGKRLLTAYPNSPEAASLRADAEATGRGEGGTKPGPAKPAPDRSAAGARTGGPAPSGGR